MDIPSIVNNFKVYSSKDSKEETLIGVGEEVTLPDLNAKTTTITGAGLLGEYEEPTLSQFEKMEMEIPFRVFYGDIVKYCVIGKAVKFIIRASIQGIDTETAESTAYGIKVTVGGKVSKVKGGKIKQAETMDCSCTISPFYYCVEGGEEADNYSKLLEIGTFTENYTVGGEDMLTDINKFL